MRLALFQPDIPQNTGAMLRLAACLGVGVDIIEPCGFPFSHKGLKRSGMDYIDHVNLTQHTGWSAFETDVREKRSKLILLTTQAATAYTDLDYKRDDIILVGRESAGVPRQVHDRAEQRVLIPMAPGTRSLNVALSAAIVLSEALRQTNSFPGPA